MLFLFVVLFIVVVVDNVVDCCDVFHGVGALLATRRSLFINKKKRIPHFTRRT